MEELREVIALLQRPEFNPAEMLAGPMHSIYTWFIHGYPWDTNEYPKTPKGIQGVGFPDVILKNTESFLAVLCPKFCLSAVNLTIFTD